MILFCAAAVIAAPAQSAFFTTLASFNGTDGTAPLNVAPAQGSDGNFYGTTELGGTQQACGSGSGCGTVFKVTPTGTLTNLYNFCSQPNCIDGFLPSAGLVLGNDNSLYGTAYYGGMNDQCYNNYGCGTVFKITSDGALTTLYNFCSQSNCADGAIPFAPVVRGSDGNFYGTTTGGGANTNCAYGCGTVFKMTPAGTLTTLYSFCSQPNCTDGAKPFGGLVQGSDGNFYGTTYYGGGSGNCVEGCGTVFKVTPSGMLTTLHAFSYRDGQSPTVGLVQASDRNFYGTTTYGGPNNSGTVFKITSNGVLTTLHNFDVVDGYAPWAALVQGNDGNLYGTTTQGGAFYTSCGSLGCGTVFKMTLAGTLTTLHSFDITDGGFPYGLLQGRDGNLYGTAGGGGAYGYGTVFRVGVPRACAACRP
jgi:uncharacterized repeat protein (TIGR03803 family)